MQPEDRDIALLWDILEAAKDIHDFVKKTNLTEKIPALIEILNPLIPKIK